ncbi:MAG TPA: helix-turn-helix domain-containing protein [Kribbella sp.]
MADTPQQRFLKLDQVGEELNISTNQVYALVRRGDLQAIKIGGRGQWRVERDRLEEYIEHAYAETREFIEAHPIEEEATPDLAPDDAAPPGPRGPETTSSPHLDGERGIAPSNEPAPATQPKLQTAKASLADRARQHADNEPSTNATADLGTGRPDPAITRQPQM